MLDSTKIKATVALCHNKHAMSGTFNIKANNVWGNDHDSLCFISAP